MKPVHWKKIPNMDRISQFWRRIKVEDWLGVAECSFGCKTYRSPEKNKCLYLLLECSFWRCLLWRILSCFAGGFRWCLNWCKGFFRKGISRNDFLCCTQVAEVFGGKSQMVWRQHWPSWYGMIHKGIGTKLNLRGIIVISILRETSESS